MNIINIEHLKYKYPGTEKLALDDISLSIKKGEFIGIIGANGAGKSTLTQAIIGLVPRFYNGAYGGKVTVNDTVVEECPVEEMCEQVGLIFQNPFNQLSGAKETVYDELAFGLQNLGIPREEMKSRIDKALKDLDIWEYRERNPYDLSGGQMQRVAIASILVMQPDVVILDEPTSQLDPQGTEEVFRVVEDLRKTGITIIMVEQKMEKIAAYCDRVILMHESKVVDFDTPEKIFSRNDLDKMGIQPPAFTRICRQYRLENADGTYPATLLATLKLFQGNKDKIKDFRSLKASPSGTVHSQKEEKSSDPYREAVTSENSSSEGLSETSMFKVEDLSFFYKKGVSIFEKLNLNLDQRRTAIIGQNGAGKTTLVRLLKGLLKPLDGKIYFGKEDISGKTVAMLADKVGYVFQNPDGQIFKYKVLDEVMYGPLNVGMTKEKAQEEALKALKLMGLSGREAENPYDLELYERKMVAIASVVAMDTDVLILDEPTIAQDYSGREIIGHMIEELAKKGKLVIAILHDMDFVDANFERVIVMAHGKILADGIAEEVFSKEDVLKEARLQKPYYRELQGLLEATINEM